MELGVCESLPREVRIALVYELTAHSALGRDWTGLADYIGFTSTHIRLLDQNQRPDKAWLLFQAWDRTGRSSVHLLIIALRQLGYQSSLAILTELQDQIDCDAIFAEIEQLKAEGGDKLVQSRLFPRFRETDVILYPEVISKETEDVLCPEVTPQESSLLTEPPQPCRTLYSQSPSCMPWPASKQHRPPGGNSHCVGEVTQQMECIAGDSISKIQPNSVFISYYPESKKHRQQVAGLVQQLTAQGYTIFFDELCKNAIKRSGGLTRWKESCIEVAENIIVVCSPNYYREDLELSNTYTGQKPKLSKLQVAVDTHLLRNLAYTGGCGRLVPVVMGRDDPNVCMPVWLQRVMIHHWPSQKEDLLCFIAGVPKFKMPPVVKRIVLKPKIIDFPEAYDWKTQC